MEPQNLVIEHLKAIRESIDANGKRIEANTAVLAELGEKVEANTARLGNVEEAIVGYTAQITMFSRSLTVQMEARSRLEDKVEDLAKRLEAIEQKG